MWIVGDSHVFWFERFMASMEVRFSDSLLECHDCQIAFHWYREGTVRTPQTARLTMMYKIQHGLVDIPLSKYTQPARTHCATEHLAAGRRGHPLQLMVQRSRLQAYKHSFFIGTIEPWNKLAVQTINAPSIEAFKQCLEA